MIDVIHANGAAIPVMGLGTGRLKGEIAIAAIHAALDSGYRHIDTAAKYGNETDVGEALRTHPMARSDIFVTTKVMAAGLSGSEGATDPQASLKRLGLDYVDLLLLHWPNQHTPLADQLQVLVSARRQGLARHIGVSNFSKAYIDAAVRLCAEPLVANQVERHPYFSQEPLAHACAAHGIALIGFCPMGRGMLLEEPVIVDIARRLSRTPAQVVLRWQVQTPMNAVVPSSSSPQRIAANIDLNDFALTDDEMARVAALARPDNRVVKGPAGFDWEGTPLV